MKKIVIALLLLVALVATLASCGTFVCDMCEEEKTGTQHEFEILGEKVVYCDDCAEELEELGEDLGDLFG
ncbi:MAG: hypothetical protein IJW49_10615 [Clostridia bacterium]|nr:hypothetical protein [Clostridia bacterium]